MLGVATRASGTLDEVEVELSFELGLEVLFELIDLLVHGPKVIATPAKAKTRLALTEELPSVDLEGACAFIGVSIAIMLPVEGLYLDWGSLRQKPRHNDSYLILSSISLMLIVQENLRYARSLVQSLSLIGVRFFATLPLFFRNANPVR